ncbi:metallophosphoesterase [Aureibaculum sp. 2210JD6-5]|uniref:metallophosphoesterase family protein n=1 Tax=Aureibaculum sp. 2210JD6-5 TaxID=3103957 RepID=UPI002AAC9306|nr:metallophosphoesterase [Aureibaculum sp. 2210JD6-5]MDY7395152.1 metallophosphoesterase [Aureibaculum sp. 2210JD6-5]
MSKPNNTKRRQFIKKMGLVAGVSAFTPITLSAQNSTAKNNEKRVLRVAHITDIHMSADNDAPNRFKKCLTEIKEHKVDFFLNGGDTIMAADYSDITRESVLEQWKLWDDLKQEFKGYEMYSCLGNHDMWWAAPDKTDAMYGKDYVIKRMEMQSRYYSVTKNGWHFIILDSNNANAGSLDQEQRKWLENELNTLPKGASVMVMTHYPILGVTTIPYGGNHTDSKYITKLFYQHQDKNIHCISGHMHLLDTAVYNNVHYYCNGSMSGFWWGEGDKDSAGKCWYHETPPGYSIIDFFEDGSINNTYYPHAY